MEKKNSVCDGPSLERRYSAAPEPNQSGGGVYHTLWCYKHAAHACAYLHAVLLAVVLSLCSFALSVFFLSFPLYLARSPALPISNAAAYTAKASIPLRTRPYTITTRSETLPDPAHIT
jgi:hypothetical protein